MASTLHNYLMFYTRLLLHLNKIHWLGHSVGVVLLFKCRLLYGYLKHMSASCSLWPEVWNINGHIGRQQKGVISDPGMMSVHCGVDLHTGGEGRCLYPSTAHE